jgi:hypothetical protein
LHEKMVFGTNDKKIVIPLTPKIYWSKQTNIESFKAIQIQSVLCDIN